MNWITRCALLALLLLALPALGDMQEQMNELRRRFPEPQNVAEENGRVLFTSGDEGFTMLRVRGLAERVKLTGNKDLILLMSYLRDSDLRIRYLAAYLLAQRLGVFDSGEPPEDAVKNLDSAAHRNMVDQFATRIAEQGAAPLPSAQRAGPSEGAR